MEYKINIQSWHKGMKIKCPECSKKVGVKLTVEPCVCKCGVVLKPFLTNNFRTLAP